MGVRDTYVSIKLPLPCVLPGDVVTDGTLRRRCGEVEDRAPLDVCSRRLTPSLIVRGLAGEVVDWL
jgi:hypothetical protein